jgi:phosphopantothenoylcysteine decarboxylase/phosphopantothenate--cysteine ligase
VAKQKRVILGVTGSIAAYKSAEIIRRLIEKGLQVSVIMTREAEYFIAPLTLAALSGKRVYRGMFDKKDDPEKAPHITLAQEADVLLIAPATANIIGKLANGIADNLLTCVALATKAPTLIAPAMNTQMYQNKIVQDNCRKLKKYGAQFIDPIRGKLACGTTGKGHIADEETIIKAVLKAVK